MLPHHFLAQVAQQYGLSQDQAAVFLHRMGDGLDYSEIAQRLGTSAGACLKRMGQVYTKFGIIEGHRGKESRLRSFLEEQYQQDLIQSQRSTSPPLIVSNSSKLYENLPHQECSIFVGRQAELDRLLELLQPDHSAHLISIDGVGGVGKTALALEAAYRCFQASQQAETGLPTFGAFIFASAKQHYLVALNVLQRHRPERTLQDLCRTIADTLEQPEISAIEFPQQIEMIRSLLRKQRALLIVDNLETLEDQQSVLSFLYDLPPTVKVILTTREQAIFVPIRLDALTVEDGLALIRHEFQEKTYGQSLVLPPGQAQLLYQATAGIPAAIVYSIGQLASGYAWTTVLANLSSATGDIARFCFESAVERLRGTPAHQILMTLPLLFAPVSREAIAQIALDSPDPTVTTESLVKLQRLSLVRQTQDRYGVLSLARHYALGELSRAPDFEAQLRSRWVNWYLQCAQTYGNLDEKTWCVEYNQLDLEWKNLQAVMEWCIVQDKFAEALILWRSLKGYAQIRGYWDCRLDWTAWLVEAAQRQEESAIWVELMNDRAWALTLTRQPELLQQANNLLERVWELRQHLAWNAQVELSSRIAVLNLQLQRLEKASQWLDTHRKLLRKKGLSKFEQERQQIQGLYYQAQIYFRKQDYAQAQKIYRQALEKARAMPWLRLEIAIQNWLADIEIAMSNSTAAHKILEQSYPIAQANQDKYAIAFHQRSYALVAQQQGEREQAQQWAMEAIENFRTLRMFPQVTELKGLLGS